MLKYVSSSDSASGKPLMLSSSEVSGSFIVYELEISSKSFLTNSTNSFEVIVNVSTAANPGSANQWKAWYLPDMLV